MSQRRLNTVEQTLNINRLWFPDCEKLTAYMYLPVLAVSVKEHDKKELVLHITMASGAVSLNAEKICLCEFVHKV